jgi:hypothetical protein
MTTTTTKPVSVTALIRQRVLQHRDATARDLQGKLAAAGFPNVKMSTITTIRADTLATLREAAALGLLRSEAEPVSQPEPEPEPVEPDQLWEPILPRRLSRVRARGGGSRL